MPDEFITSATDCEQKLSKLCVHKAMGPDNIPNWIIKYFSYILAAPIAAIYNSSLIQSYVPPSWKQAEILPIPKVSEVISLAKHLRPIALTPVLFKVLESFGSDEEKLGQLIVTPEVVASKINNMEENKSPGVDGLSPKILKETVEQISKPLAHVFNMSLHY